MAKADQREKFTVRLTQEEAERLVSLMDDAGMCEGNYSDFFYEMASFAAGEE